MADEKSSPSQRLIAVLRSDYAAIMGRTPPFAKLEAMMTTLDKSLLDARLMQMQKIEDPEKIDYSVLDESGGLSSSEIKDRLDKQVHEARMTTMRLAYATVDKARLAFRDADKPELLPAIYTMHSLLDDKDFAFSTLDPAGKSSDADMRGKVVSAITIVESRLNRDITRYRRDEGINDGGQGR